MIRKHEVTFLCICVIYFVKHFFLNNSFIYFRKNREIDNLLQMPWWEKSTCASYDINEANEYKAWKNEELKNTTCGFKSWKLGPGKKVISYSLFGSNTLYSR